uniref:Phosphoserine phosphatase n=1 Tax=Cacopsylla melanoneura TaxID=428564 RepID=A0A8D8ZQI3_9HEMI
MVLTSGQSRWSLVRLVLVVSSLSVANVEGFGEIRALKLKFLNLLGYKMNPEAILRSADAVCFDVDSTLFTTEGVDELTEFMNKTKETKHQPLAALCGVSNVRKAMEDRMNLLKPSIEDMKQFNKERSPKISTGAV